MPSWHPLPQLSIGPRRRSQVSPLSFANTTTARAAVAVSADPAVAITCGLSPQLAQVAFIPLFAVIHPAAPGYHGR